MYENSPGILLPWPPQEVLVYRGVAMVQFHVLLGAIYHTVLENQACGLSRVRSSMGCHSICFAFLGIEWPGADQDEAVVEDWSGVAEDEVHVALDAAWLVELAKGVNVEGVLIAYEFAVFDYR